MISRFFVMSICRQPTANSQKHLCRLLLTLLSLSLLLLCSPLVVHASWFQQPSGTSANLKKVFFVDAQSGWAVGDGNFMLRTTDGGNHWVSNIIDTLISHSEALWFQDANLGWVGGSNGLYKTTDGGINWQFLQNLTGDHFRDVVFVTPQKGWATKISGPDTFGFFDTWLYRSSDGGVAWELRESSDLGGFWDISFADSMVGMLAEGRPGVFHGDSWGATRRTTDGGETWQVLPYQPDSYMWYASPMNSNVHLLNRNYAWRASYTLGWYMGLSFESGGISKTTIGGDTWTRMLNGTGYVLGWGGRQNLPGGTLAFGIVDTLKGYILYSDDLMGTLDGGATWVTLSLPGVKHDICFSDSLNGWIVGDQGLILHTTDGGLGVWQEPSSRLTSYASRLTVFPNPFTSFALVPGHSSERFALYDISGRKVGVFKGDRIGLALSAGVYFLKPEGLDTKPLRVVKLR